MAMKPTDKMYRPSINGIKNQIKPVKPGTKPKPPQGVKPVKRPTTMPIKTNKPKPRPTTKPIKPGTVKRGM